MFKYERHASNPAPDRLALIGHSFRARKPLEERL
jgi:hypothetical protein